MSLLNLTILSNSRKKWTSVQPAYKFFEDKHLTENHVIFVLSQLMTLLLTCGTSVRQIINEKEASESPENKNKNSPLCAFSRHKIIIINMCIVGNPVRVNSKQVGVNLCWNRWCQR
jgi:hypothetical protein